MKAKEIYQAIAVLGKITADERTIRDSAQILLLEISGAGLGKGERESLLIQLRTTLRNKLTLCDAACDTDLAEINSLLEEMCLAASFYLLEKGKRINLFCENEAVFARLALRSFENCFYKNASALLRENDEVSVYIKQSAAFCTLIFRADSCKTTFGKTYCYYTFSVFENGVRCPCIRLEKCHGENPSPTVDEDFSMLLHDPLSPMQIWLCDI